LRVLTLSSLFPNRVQPVHGIFVYQRVAQLARRPGNEVHVIAPAPYFPRWLPTRRWKAEAQMPLEERIGGLNVYHPRYPLLPRISMPLHGLLLFLGIRRLAKRLHKQVRFDCIDAHFVYPDGFAAVLLGKMLRLPVVVSARGTDINLYPSFRLIRPMIRWTLRRASGAVAVSASLLNVMLGLGLEAKKGCVIGNGIDPQRFHPVDPLEARAHLGLPERAKIIVSVGALIPRKGFHFLIPSVAEIAPRFPGLRLYILGEGEFRAPLEKLLADYKLQGSVFLPGSKPNEDLRDWFSAADLSCLVSSREGWPNVIQESLACGTPVLATRLWGAPEIIVSDELGLLVAQGKDAISAGLEAALTKNWDRKFIAAHAGKRTWETVAREVEEFLVSRISDFSSVLPGQK